MTNSIPHPHDAFSKRFLTDLAVARDFLKHHLPTDIVNRCDFNTLRLEPTSYVEPELRQHMTDVLYSLRVDNKEAYIYCLVEQQSEPDKFMALRIWRYNASILKRYHDSYKDQLLPVILNLVFYTGKDSPYPYSCALTDCFDDQKLAKRFLNEPFNLIDLSVMADDQIKQHGKAALLEIVMKHSRSRDAVLLARLIINTLTIKEAQISRDLYRDVLEYALNAIESEKYEQFFNILSREHNEIYRGEVMTMMESLKKDVRLEVAQNMANKGLDISLIKEVTKLSDAELKKARIIH